MLLFALWQALRFSFPDKNERQCIVSSQRRKDQKDWVRTKMKSCAQGNQGAKADECSGPGIKLSENGLVNTNLQV